MGCIHALSSVSIVYCVCVRACVCVRVCVFVYYIVLCGVCMRVCVCVALLKPQCMSHN